MTNAYLPRRFSTEKTGTGTVFRDKACRKASVSNAHEPLATIANKLGIGYSTLDKWLRQSTSSQSSKRLLSPEQQQILELQKEVKQLREANDILKKAHVYFLGEAHKKSTR